jgi:hypothetical protein
MHFLMNLLRYMLPIETMVFNQSDDVTSGFDRVITSRNNFVVTSRNNFVIAKHY